MFYSMKFLGEKKCLDFFFPTKGSIFSPGLPLIEGFAMAKEMTGEFGALIVIIIIIIIMVIV